MSCDFFDEARSSISEFCINECKAYCCRKGYLILNKTELFVVGDDLLKVTSMKDGRFSLNLNGGCFSLGFDFKCNNYLRRPDTCKTFPIFVVGNEVRLSPRCLAVKEGLLYPFIKQFLKAGYVVSEPN